MKKLALLLATAVVAACGGGGGDTATTNPPSVAAITAGPVMYGAAVTFTVSGSNLDQPLAVAATGACTSVLETGTGSATTRTFACQPTALGALNVFVAPGSGGNALKSVTVTVPVPRVTLATSQGTIVVELDPAHAPITVNNFLQYVRSGFYAGTIFHRVVAGFVVQGGGFTANLTQKATNAPIKLEAPATTGLSNTQGTIAMARTTVLDSATSQFFFNTVDNKALDTSGGGYAVFGTTVQGFDVVKKIEAIPVDANSIPTTTVTITSATQTQ